MGLAKDLKALQELREKGELSESAYTAARDAAIGKQSPVQSSTSAAKKPLISTLIKVIVALAVLFVGANILYHITQTAQKQASSNFLHTPQTITDEVENVPAASGKAINYGLPQGGKLDIAVKSDVC
jgi:cytoskeletal protein RodZ